MTKEETIEELIQTLKQYLQLNSLDGKSERQPLRKKLKELVEQYETGLLKDNRDSQ